MKRLRNVLRSSVWVGGSFIKWLIIAITVGTLVGVIGGLFGRGIHVVTEIREQVTWIFWLLPIGGLLIVLLYHVLGLKDNRGTNSVLAAVHSGERLSIKVLLGIFLSTITTHLLGGSAGREGAALQIGGSFCSEMGRRLKLNPREETIITMCGMSAGFAALFSTPVAATVFALEVVSVGIMHYSGIVPCLVAGIFATIVSGLVGVKEPSFAPADLGQLSLNLPLIGKVLIIGIVGALVSVLFCVVIHAGHDCFKRVFKNQYLRIFVGGVILILLTLLFGVSYSGAGTNIILNAIDGKSNWYDFIIKIIFTAITLGCGFKGGEIVPSFFVGATFGCAASVIVGLPPGFGATLGMIAVFCGVTNCPLASIVLSVELFGAQGLPYYALVCVVSYMLSGYNGLYSEQKILYSKYSPTFINIKTGNHLKSPPDFNDHENNPVR